MDKTIEIEMLPPTPLKQAPNALQPPRSPQDERRLSKLIKSDYRPIRSTQ